MQEKMAVIRYTETASALYAALYAPGESGQANRPVKYDVRLRRMLCDAFNDFVSGSSYAKPKYRFGDGAAEAAISAGIESGLVGEKGGRIFLTKDGERQAEKMWNDLSKDDKISMNRLRDVYEHLTLDEALVIFYCDYPDRANKAGERSEFDRNRLDCAISMAQAHHISVSRGARIAGMRLREFEDEMVRRGIRPYVYDREAFENDLKNIKALP